MDTIVVKRVKRGHKPASDKIDLSRHWTLPTEVNVEIAKYLDDPDICSFAAVCHETHKITADNSELWKHKFCQEFDRPKDGKHYYKELKKLYQLRRRLLLRNDATFKDGSTRKETNIFPMLIDMVKQAYPSHFSETENKFISLNMDRLSRFALEHGLLTDVCRVFRSDAKNPVLIVLQLILVHVNLGLDVRRQPLCQTLGFDCSQKIVYETVLKQPIFMNSYTTVNVDFLLHCVNFFKYHLTRKETMTAYEAYRDLPTDYLPQGLQGNLHNDGYELGKKWMGTFGYLDYSELDLIREGDEIDWLQDKNIEDSKFQYLKMDFPTPENTPKWPLVFEKHLNAFAKQQVPRKTRAQHRSGEPVDSNKKTHFCFLGKGFDGEENFYADGWLTPLPSQHGIPGWQRVTMMKFFDDGNGSIAPQSLWAYEGVILPGGKVMVGRWWRADDDYPLSQQYSGPFIFWTIPDEAVDYPTPQSLEDADY